MIDHIILAMRVSPDWARLAQDREAGRPIDPSRYLPAHNPHFAADTLKLIERWDRLSPISFFACRHGLREIAANNFAMIHGVTVTRWTNVPALLERFAGARYLVFYHDDDDWFSPFMASAIRNLDVDAVDAVIFPFPRLGSNLLTFTRDGVSTEAAIGRCAPFRYRYCTNNYGLSPRAASTGIARLIEHVDASNRAEELGFVDAYVDAVISATNKTPCSASWLRELPDDETAFRRYIENYVAGLEAIKLPAAADWIDQPLRETIELFRAVGK